MKISTENVKHYFLRYSVPTILKSIGFPQIFPCDTLYITLVQMTCKFILKFPSNDIIFLSVQILKFHRQLQYSVYCLYLAASSFTSQTERRIFNVEWRYLSTEDITIHTSNIPIGDTSEVSLCPTYSFATHIHHRTTNLSYWGGKGAIAAMRSYSILIYQLTPHPPTPYSLAEYLPPHQSQYEINQVIFLAISQV